MNLRAWMLSFDSDGDYDWDWLQDEDSPRPKPRTGYWLRREDAVAAGKALIESVVGEAVTAYESERWLSRNEIGHYARMREGLPFRGAALSWENTHPGCRGEFTERRRVLDQRTWTLPDAGDYAELSVQLPVVERLEVSWQEAQTVTVEGQDYSRTVKHQEVLTDWLRRECTYGPQVMCIKLNLELRTFRWVGTEEDLRAALSP